MASWHPLSPPPEPLQQIQAATVDTVFAVGMSGRQYAFRDRTATAWLHGAPEGEWTAELPAAADWELSDCGRTVAVPAALPPQRQVDRLDCWVSLEGGQIGLSYALLADGRVWRWSTALPFDRVAGPACLSLLGAMVAAVLGHLALGRIPRAPAALGPGPGVSLPPPRARTNGARRPPG